jgi:hypothetical protein
VKIRPFFRWYDFWVGFYYDQRAHILYVCPLPTVGLAIFLAVRCDICGIKGDHAPYCVRRGYAR